MAKRNYWIYILLILLGNKQVYGFIRSLSLLSHYSIKSSLLKIKPRISTRFFSNKIGISNEPIKKSRYRSLSKIANFFGNLLVKKYDHNCIIESIRLGDSISLKKMLNSNDIYYNDIAKEEYKLLETAVIYGRTDCLKILLEHGVTPLESIMDNHTFPIHLAALAYYENLDIIKYLIEHKSPVNPIDIYGNTPIHYASQKGRIDTISYLIEKGGNPKIRNTKGLKPIDLAKFALYKDAVEYLTPIS